MWACVTGRVLGECEACRVWESVRHVWMGRVLGECEACVNGEGVGGV